MILSRGELSFGRESSRVESSGMYGRSMYYVCMLRAPYVWMCEWGERMQAPQKGKIHIARWIDPK